MKRLTLNNGILCEIILVLIICLLPILTFVFIFIAGSDGDISFVSCLVIIAALAINVWILIAFGPLAIGIEMMIKAQRSLKYDRKFFYPSNVFSNSQEVIQYVKSTLEKSKFNFLIISPEKMTPLFIAHQKSFSFPIDKVEKILIVYYCNNLNHNNFVLFANDVKKRIDKMKYKDSDILFSHKYVMSFFIIADHIDGNLENKIKGTITLKRGTLFPCVFDVSSNKMILDGSKYGMFYEETYVQQMIAKHILGFNNRKLPRRGNLNYIDRYAEMEKDSSEINLIDLFKELHGGIQAEKKKDFSIAKSMKNDTFLIKNDSIYYKKYDKALSVSFFTNEDGDKHLVLTPIEGWFYPRNRKILKKEIKTMTLAMESYLKENGYTYSYDFARDNLEEK